MKPIALLQPERKRILQPPFAWIDRRFLFDGFLASSSPDENLLYFFLCLVSDREGLSFYSYDKICQRLRLDLDAYIQARNGLLEKKLIAFDGRYFQVLALPQEAVKTPKPDARADRSATVPKSLAEIFKQPPFAS